MPYENEHAARIRKQDLFDKNTFRRTNGGKAVLPGSGLITIPKTVSIIWAKLKKANKPNDNPLVQSLRFPIKYWKSSEAKKWLTDNKVKHTLFEPAKKNNNNFYALDMETENKPLLLYAPLYDYVAQEFVEKMNEIQPEEDITIWMNCPGGRVFAGWSIIGPLQKRKGKKTICVFGHAMSMAVYLPLYCDWVESLEVTQFMIHRADGYVENEDDQKLLDNINKDLRKQMESRLNMDIFEQVCGCTMDDIFKAEKRKDVMLTAKQAKKLGLVNSIIKLSPEQVKAYSEQFVAFANLSQRSEIDSQRSEEYQEPEDNYFNNKKPEKMTLQELKTQHPELYTEIYNSGRKDGIQTEQVRVKSWLAYLDIDKENVISSVKDGKEFTPDIMAEMSVKMSAKATADKIKDDSIDDIPTDQPTDKTAEQKELEEYEKDVNSGINVKSITY